MRVSPPWSHVFFTVLIAFFLMLLPLPTWAIWFRPAWILITLIYWSMSFPYHINVGFAWMVGILVDVLNGSLLGEHAAALTIAIYLVVSRHSQFRMYPKFQQILWVFFITFVYQMILFGVQSLVNSTPQIWVYWTPALTSMLVWPFVLGMMRDYQRKFKTS